MTGLVNPPSSECHYGFKDWRFVVLGPWDYIWGCNLIFAEISFRVMSGASEKLGFLYRITPLITTPKGARTSRLVNHSSTSQGPPRTSTRLKPTCFWFLQVTMAPITKRAPRGSRATGGVILFFNRCILYISFDPPSSSSSSDEPPSSAPFSRQVDRVTTSRGCRFHPAATALSVGTAINRHPYLLASGCAKTTSWLKSANKNNSLFVYIISIDKLICDVKHSR